MTLLVARTRPVDTEPDLLAVGATGGYLWDAGSFVLAGAGQALRVPAGDPVAAQAALAGIGVDDRVGVPGCGTVAFGALPFEGGGGELVVPASVWGRHGGTRWVTTIGPAGEDHEPAVPTVAEGGPGPSRFTVAAARPPADWCDAVAAGRDAVRAGDLHKLVLGRAVDVTADVPVDVVALLRRLRTTYPDAFTYAVEGFVGASPELLVSRDGDRVSAHPMAGTIPRTGDPTTDARLAAGLLASAKDRDEHQITIDMVHETLLPWCSYLDYEAEPSVVAMANVAHLATTVEGRLSDPTPSVLELAAALHPTPAVGGAPRAEALALIAKLEDLDRGRFAGPVGWVDGVGNGSFAVGIRSAEVEGATVRLFAGVGVVADSDPALELAETRAKFQALLTALVQP